MKPSLIFQIRFIKENLEVFPTNPPFSIPTGQQATFDYGFYWTDQLSEGS